MRVERTRDKRSIFWAYNFASRVRSISLQPNKTYNIFSFLAEYPLQENV